MLRQALVRIRVIWLLASTLNILQPPSRQSVASKLGPSRLCHCSQDLRRRGRRLHFTRRRLLEAALLVLALKWSTLTA
jgi:hypothetical protein